MKQLWGLLDLEQKSSADEREAYIGTLSEETAIQKEHEKKNFVEFQPKKTTKHKIRAKKPYFLTESSLFLDYA